MKIILAQGNIGTEYDQTRHNLGFLALDVLAKTYQGNWRQRKDFRAVIAEVEINKQKVLLVKPTTFYNLTGISLKAVTDYYKLNPKSDVLVIHDDLALDFGTIKTRQMGSAGGNKGLQSIISQIGVNFDRIKIGIANSKLAYTSRSDFVLSKFSAEEAAQLPAILNQVQLLAQSFINDKFDSSTYKLTN